MRCEKSGDFLFAVLLHISLKHAKFLASKTLITATTSPFFLILILQEGGTNSAAMEESSSYPQMYSDATPFRNSSEKKTFVFDPEFHKQYYNFPSRLKREILSSKLKESCCNAMYTEFLANFAKLRDWSGIILLFEDENSIQGCNYVRDFFSSLINGIRIRCANEEERMGKTNASMLEGLVSLYFLQSDLGRSPLTPALLIPYVPTRPTIVLGGKSDTNKLVELVHQKNSSYKWTLVRMTDDDATGSKRFFVEDVYGFAGADPLIQGIGNWSLEDGLKIDDVLSLGPSDFQGRLIRVTTMPGPPVVIAPTRKNVNFTGYLPDMIEIISLQLNFTYKVRTPLDNKFGTLESDGTVSGMVGELYRKEAEIAMMSFSLTALRKNYMDFSPPVEYSSVRLLIRRDWKNAELKWAAFLQPLGTDVWATIPIFILLGTITLTIFGYFRVVDISPLSTIWLLMTCFILQGQEEHNSNKRTPYRLVIGTFWVLSVVLFACYTARLTAFLAANNEVLPVNSLQQAVSSKTWKVGLVKGSAFVDRIKESKVSVLRALYQRTVEDSSALVENFQDGMDKVFKERYIFFTSELIPTYLIRGNCSYTWLPADKFFSGFGYMGYQKNLPFAPIISHRLSDLRQSGQMRRLFITWWGTDSVCLGKSGESFLGMSMYETATAFVIFLGGMGLSTWLVIIECCVRKFPRQLSASTSSESGLLQKISSSAKGLEKGGDQLMAALNTQFTYPQSS